MIIENTDFPEVKKIIAFRVNDERGVFSKIINSEFLLENGMRSDFREIYYSESNKNVVRGMHFQAPPHDHAKIVHVLRGEVEDVIIDLRRTSVNFGKCISIKLSENIPEAIYIPEGFAHGFASLKDRTMVLYAVTSCYCSEADKGICWNSIPHDWKIKHPIISERDKSFPRLESFQTPF